MIFPALCLEPFTFSSKNIIQNEGLEFYTKFSYTLYSHALNSIIFFILKKVKSFETFWVWVVISTDLWSLSDLPVCVCSLP